MEVDFGMTGETFYHPYIEVGKLENTVIDFDLQSLQSALEARPNSISMDKLLARIREHYFDSSRLIKRAYLNRMDDDFQLFNWGLSLISEFGLIGDKVDVLILIYGKTTPKRVVRQEFDKIILRHTTFRNLDQSEKKARWLDIKASFKIHAVSRKRYYPKTIGKRELQLIVEVNDLELDFDIGLFTAEQRKNDRYANRVHMLLVEDPLISGKKLATKNAQEYVDEEKRRMARFRKKVEAEEGKFSEEMQKRAEEKMKAEFEAKEKVDAERRSRREERSVARQALKLAEEEEKRVILERAQQLHEENEREERRRTEETTMIHEDRVAYALREWERKEREEEHERALRLEEGKREREEAELRRAELETLIEAEEARILAQLKREMEALTGDDLIRAQTRAKLTAHQRMRAAEKEKEKLEIQLLAELRLASYNEKEREKDREKERERQKELYFKSAVAGEIVNPVDASTMLVTLVVEPVVVAVVERSTSLSPTQLKSLSPTQLKTARSQSTFNTSMTDPITVQTDAAIAEDVIQPVKKMSVFMPKSPIQGGKHGQPLVARALSPQNMTVQMIGEEFGYDIHKGEASMNMLFAEQDHHSYRRTQSATTGYRTTTSIGGGLHHHDCLLDGAAAAGTSGGHRPMTMQEKRNISHGHTPSYQYHQMARSFRTTVGTGDSGSPSSSKKPISTRALSPLPHVLPKLSLFSSSSSPFTGHEQVQLLTPLGMEGLVDAPGRSLSRSRSLFDRSSNSSGSSRRSLTAVAAAAPPSPTTAAAMLRSTTITTTTAITTVLTGQPQQLQSTTRGGLAPSFSTVQPLPPIITDEDIEQPQEYSDETKTEARATPHHRDQSPPRRKPPGRNESSHDYGHDHHNGNHDDNAAVESHHNDNVIKDSSCSPGGAPVIVDADYDHRKEMRRKRILDEAGALLDGYTMLSARAAEKERAEAKAARYLQLKLHHDHSKQNSVCNNNGRGKQGDRRRRRNKRSSSPHVVGFASDDYIASSATDTETETEGENDPGRYGGVRNDKDGTKVDYEDGKEEGDDGEQEVVRRLVLRNAFSAIEISLQLSEDSETNVIGGGGRSRGGETLRGAARNKNKKRKGKGRSNKKNTKAKNHSSDVEVVSSMDSDSDFILETEDEDDDDNDDEYNYNSGDVNAQHVRGFRRTEDAPVIMEGDQEDEDNDDDDDDSMTNKADAAVERRRLARAVRRKKEREEQHQLRAQKVLEREAMLQMAEEFELKRIAEEKEARQRARSLAHGQAQQQQPQQQQQRLVLINAAAGGDSDSREQELLQLSSIKATGGDEGQQEQAYSLITTATGRRRRGGASTDVNKDTAIGVPSSSSTAINTVVDSGKRAEKKKKISAAATADKWSSYIGDDEKDDREAYESLLNKFGVLPAPNVLPNKNKRVVVLGGDVKQGGGKSTASTTTTAAAGAGAAGAAAANNNVISSAAVDTSKPSTTAAAYSSSTKTDRQALMEEALRKSAKLQEQERTSNRRRQQQQQQQQQQLLRQNKQEQQTMMMIIPPAADTETICNNTSHTPPASSSSVLANSNHEDNDCGTVNDDDKADVEEVDARG